MQRPGQQLLGQAVTIIQRRHHGCGQLLQDATLQGILDDCQPLICIKAMVFTFVV